MKSDLSFKLLAATVYAGLFLSLVDADSARENPAMAAAAADVAAVSAPATVSANAPAATPVAISGAVALAER